MPTRVFTVLPTLSNARVLLRKIERRELTAIVDISFYDGATNNALSIAVLERLHFKAVRRTRGRPHVRAQTVVLTNRSENRKPPQ